MVIHQNYFFVFCGLYNRAIFNFDAMVYKKIIIV